MTYRVVIHRNGFEVYKGKVHDPGKSITLEPRSNLSVFVALLVRFRDEGKNFTLDEFRKFHVWSALKNKSSAHRTLDRYVEQIENFKWPLRFIRVDRGVGVSRGTYRLAVSEQTTLSISDELETILFPAIDKVEDWRAYPPHVRSELANFVATVYESAIDFDIGDVTKAAETLADGIQKLDSPYYRIVVLMRLARSKFRLGLESEANTYLIDAERLISLSIVDDAILRARAAYN
jgi:hypothetical protein